MIIAVIICRLLWFSCKLIAFHADLCLLSMQACQMTATVGRHIIEGGSLYSPTCIETVVKPPSYLAVLKTASIFMGPSLAGLVFRVREQQS